jgi:hypothetical protein
MSKFKRAVLLIMFIVFSTSALAPFIKEFT